MLQGIRTAADVYAEESMLGQVNQNGGVRAFRPLDFGSAVLAYYSVRCTADRQRRIDSLLQQAAVTYGCQFPLTDGSELFGVNLMERVPSGVEGQFSLQPVSIGTDPRLRQFGWSSKFAIVQASVLEVFNRDEMKQIIIDLYQLLRGSNTSESGVDDISDQLSAALSLL